MCDKCEDAALFTVKDTGGCIIYANTLKEGPPLPLVGSVGECEKAPGMVVLKLAKPVPLEEDWLHGLKSHFTPGEARNLAWLLLEKADDMDGGESRVV